MIAFWKHVGRFGTSKLTHTCGKNEIEKEVETKRSNIKKSGRVGGVGGRRKEQVLDPGVIWHAVPAWPKARGGGYIMAYASAAGNPFFEEVIFPYLFFQDWGVMFDGLGADLEFM